MLGQVQDIDLKLLRVFRTVVRNGGFAAAQTELNVSLPTISLQMKQLEERLGLRLCERGHGGFRLTSHGEAVMRSADPLFTAIHQFHNDLDDITYAPLGEVKLGMLDHLAPNPDCKVHQAVSKLHEDFTGINLVFFVGLPTELESQIVNGTLDVAVGLFPRTNAALSYLTLFEEEHDLYCGAGHPLFDRKSSDLDPVELVACDYVSWAGLEPLVATPITPRFRIRSGTPFMQGVVTLLQSGRFIGYLPRYFAERWVEAGQIRSLLPGIVSRRIEVTAISRQDGRQRRGVAALHDELITVHQSLKFAHA